MADTPNEELNLEPEDLLAEMGTTGLRETGGFIDEEWLPKLKGVRGMRIIRQMTDNDDAIGAASFAIDHLARSVKWTVKPADEEDSESAKWADFVRENLKDMKHTFNNWVAGALSFKDFGWSWSEIVYKVRLGEAPGDGKKTSRFNDGLWGWHKFAPRSQDTVYRWEMDDAGDVLGLWQFDGYSNKGNVLMPISKSIHLTTPTAKNNPEGRSIWRNAYRSWWKKSGIEDYEAIGVERGLAGLVEIQVPPDILSPNASDEKKALRRHYEEMVRKLRRGQLEGVLFPAEEDREGNSTQYKLTLKGPTGKRNIDTDPIIKRYRMAIMQSVIMDWILLGQQSVGSFALASSRTQVSSLAIGCLLDEIQDAMNLHVIPQLMKLNGVPEEHWPTMEHSDIETPDLKEMGEFMSKVFSILGIEGDPSLERWVRGLIGAPEMEEAKEFPERLLRRTPPNEEDGETGEDIPGGRRPTAEIFDPLNGAQMKAVQDTLVAVGTGEMPKEVAEEFIVFSTGRDRVIVKQLLAGAKRIEPEGKGVLGKPAIGEKKEGNNDA